MGPSDVRGEASQVLQRACKISDPNAGWQGQELISRAESFARDATHDWPKQEILIDNHRKSFFNKDSM